MSTSTDKAPRKNLTAKVRNQITEMADDGATVAQIASECGITVEKVEATLAAAAEGKSLAEAEKAAAAAAAAPADEAPAAPKPPKPVKVERFRREPAHVQPDGKVIGVRLFGVREDGHDDLGVHGTTNEVGPAVDAYEKTHKDAKYSDYLAVPQRFVWLVK